jgi:sarcosine oxidase, subunit gamma
MSEPYRRSPLRHRSEIVAPDAVARLVERAFHGKLVLRGDPALVDAAVKAVAGLSLPEPCRAMRDAETAVLWIGPDEHWIVTAADRAPALAAALGDSLAGIHHQIVDVSDYYATIKVSGPRAREMLMKLTTLDLHPRAFAEGQVAGSMFGHAQAYLWQRVSDGEGPAFELFVRRTMADYMWCLLAEAGREFGLPSQAPLAGENWRLER